MTRSALARGLYFFGRFLRHPRQVGALLPSSRHLGDAMVRDLALRPDDVVVEYGPGTGALTATIARRVAAAGGRYLGIERDAGFHAMLQQRFAELDFEHGDVLEVRDILASRGLPAPRAILSGLPLILLPAMDAIVDTAAELLPVGGEFRTFSYLQSYVTPGASRLRQRMRQRFTGFTMGRLVLRNLPPAWVMRGVVAEREASRWAVDPMGH